MSDQESSDFNPYGILEPLGGKNIFIYFVILYLWYYNFLIFEILVAMNMADDMYYQQDEYTRLKENTIPSERIEIIEKLASGQFGTVYKGK